MVSIKREMGNISGKLSNIPGFGIGTRKRKREDDELNDEIKNDKNNNNYVNSSSLSTLISSSSSVSSSTSLLSLSSSNKKLKKNESINEQIFLHINDFPDDILFEIFKFLTPSELMITGQVSQKFEYISMHAVFWRELKFGILNGTDEESTEKIKKLLKFAGLKLRTLDLTERSDCDAILAVVTQHNKNLETLSMTRCRGKLSCGFINATIIVNVLLKLRKLKSLRMFNTNFRSVKFFKIFGSRQFMSLRNKKFGKNLSILKPQSITYTGVLTFKQLEAYTKHANTNGRITLHSGQEYSVREIRDMLENTTFEPNSIVRTLN